MIEVEARILETVGEGAFRAELPNGKCVIAHFPSQGDATGGSVAEAKGGDLVRLAMSPYDFSRGRILEVVGRAEKGE